MPRKKSLVAPQRIEKAILLIRGQKVILDSDLAEIYGVTTTRLNQQVGRNIDRFPDDFSFILSQQEVADLKLQIATSNVGRGGRRKPPRVFTEHGAVMAASVLNTPIAVAASIEVVRTFVRLRQFLAAHSELEQHLRELEARLLRHDEQLVVVFEAIHQLMEPPPAPQKTGRIGFQGSAGT